MQVGLVQVGLVQVGPAQVGLVQVGLVQVGPFTAFFIFQPFCMSLQNLYLFFREFAHSPTSICY